MRVAGVDYSRTLVWITLVVMHGQEARFVQVHTYVMLYYSCTLVRCVRLA